ncbi:traG-like protein [Clostridium sp. CAG:354]|nr:type IV secretory system conjugative DNA transfer family protein [Clostridia bacterium]CDE11668.1 traG-like protein [Clostridium sp. CAG:354]
MLDGSGSGKSASYSIPNAYQCLGSYIFTDPKGELYDRTAGYLKSKGYKVRVLNLVNPECSDGYNPLAHIRNEIDVDIIANTIVKGQSGEKASDPFWDDMAEILLKALIWYLISTRPPEEQNLASCAELVRAANDSGGTSLLGDLINQLDYTHPARKNYKSIEIAPEKTRGSILSTLQSRLGKFDSKDIADLTSSDTINFEEIGQEKTAVYVVSSDTHTTYNFLLTIFFSQMIQQLYDYADKAGGKLPEKTFFILDEFANIGQIPDFDKKISTSRSRGISFSVILQNLDQLEAVYEKSYETIIGNCDTHVFLGSNSTKTLEYFSKALGEKTISRDSHSTNRDKGGWKSGSSDSDQIMGRALLTPDELRRFDNDMCIIFVKGVRPIKANKFYYFRKPMGREMARLEISHNDAEVGERGEWRVFNPANPYSLNSETKTQDLKVESLDDLFADDEPSTPKKETANVATGSTNGGGAQNTNTADFTKPKSKPMEIPLEDNNEEVNNIDLEKALEAKFDELFGTDDD